VILPLCASIYFLCYLDRSNIGNARILNSSTKNDMQTETNTTVTQFNIALMIFLVAYALFEVPSNILLKKLRPSRWLAFLMFTWGAITIGLGGVNTFSEMTAVRFLLGMSEAGLSAWRWLFIIEGVPSCVSAFLVWFLLPNYPEQWHRGKDREIALHRLRVEGSKSHHRSMTWKDAKETLLDWRLYGHYLIYFGISVPFSSLSLFTPAITSGLGYVDLQAQLMTVPPYAVAYGKHPLALEGQDCKLEN
jgi:sugar phosphate permease